MWTWRCDGYYHQIAAIKQAVHDAVDKLTSAGAKDLALLWPLSLPRLPGIKSSWLEDSSSEVMECGGCPAVRSFSDSDCVPFVSYTFTLAFLLLADSSIVTDCSGCETPRFDFYHHSFLSTSTAQFVHYHVQIYWCSLVVWANWQIAMLLEMCDRLGQSGPLMTFTKKCHCKGLTDHKITLQVLQYYRWFGTKIAWVWAMVTLWQSCFWVRDTDARWLNV
jgi:hypothetical protein